MAELAPDVAAEMNKRAQEIKERRANSTFTKSWSLGGKNAIVPEGGEVIVRLLPRWDYINAFKKDPAGKLVQNPDYKKGRMFLMAYEHWWENDGRWTREWCAKTPQTPDVPCPICEASERLRNSANADDKKFGRSIRAQEAYVFNALVGKPRRLDSGKADIRTITLSDGLFEALRDIMTGGEKGKDFARGDVTDPWEGLDLGLKRPVKKSGQRWTMSAASGASRIYDADQAEAFKGWPLALINLEEMLTKETKDYAGLYKSYYGQDMPATAGGTPAPQAPAPAQPASAPPVDADVFGAPEASAEPPTGPDDDFMPPPPAAPSGRPGTSPAPKAAPRKR